MDMYYALKYNKITIAKRCINKNIRYVGEYQLKIKTTKEINNRIKMSHNLGYYLNYCLNLFDI